MKDRHGKKTELELTWIGKENRPKLEPIILLEDPKKSFHAAQRVSDKDIFDNVLIYGDNLLALKALEQEYTGKIKCIYIDPPFNTGQAFEHYEDGIEHSLWLSLMRDRLEILRSLLSEDGAIFVEIDDTECSYLQILLDEIFGRRNRVLTVSVKRSAATGHKAINPTPVNVTEYIHIYAKNKSLWQYKQTFVARGDYDWAYSIRLINPLDSYPKWKFEPLAEHVASKLSYKTAREGKKAFGKKKFEEQIIAYALKHPEEVIRFALPNYKGVSKAARELIDKSKNNGGEVLCLPRDNYADMYFKDGNRILFLKNKVGGENREVGLIEPLTNWWDDIPWQGIAREGNVIFPKAKKPEKLIKRILDMATNPGDWILDIFAGSGTTGAVSHKMGRKWIMVELGKHCHTHIIPRIKNVIDGKDQSGISKAVNWRGGGGFRYYRLAPTLVVNDKWGNPVINPEYNSAMLAEAMCKLHAFTYAPSDEYFWMHGYSTENDFIYITTQFMTAAILEKISEEVGPKRSLLICCNAFKVKPDRFENLTFKKIPKSVLHKCEWRHDDYSLEIQNLPKAPETPEEETQDKTHRKQNKQQQRKEAMLAV